MKWLPILFQGPMVVGILFGRKTKTRRAVKGMALTWLESGLVPEFVASPENGLCPYGKLGDRLWVRETWGILKEDGELSGWPTFEHETYNIEGGDASFDGKGNIVYRAGGDVNFPRMKGYRGVNGKLKCVGGWRPSIFMPRWACRIKLEIIGVKIERLKDISDRDAEAEGIFESHAIGDDAAGSTWTWQNVHGTWRYDTPRQAFQALWKSINGEASWDANPWVWVIEFKKVKA